MNSNSNILGVGSNCVPQETLIKYIKGELSGPEMNAVEKHIAGCPMCSDELEGLSLLEQPDDIKNITHSINQRIEESISQRDKNFWHSTQLRVAASILLLIAVSGVIYFMSTLKSPSETISELIMLEQEATPDDSLEMEVEDSEEIIPLTRSEEIKPKDEIRTEPAKPREEKRVLPTQPEEVVLEDLDSDLMLADAPATKAAETIAETRLEQAMGASAPSTASRKKDTSPARAKKPQALNIIVFDDHIVEEKVAILDSSVGKDYSTIIAFGINTLEEEIEEEEIFLIVEKMPSFQGGDSSKFMEYISKNLKYPEAAAEKSIQGKVFISFVVEEDGSVTNVKVVKGVDPLIDEEAVRVVKSSPKWEPGKQRGKLVRVQFTFPVTFILQ